MKKTVLGIITVVMLVAVMLSTSVNAASLSTDKTKMEKGEVVTVTVKTDEAVESMQFDLKFDTTKYKFVEGSIKTDLRTLDYNVNGDKITISAFDTSATTDTLTLQFEAIENGTKVPFEISDAEFSNDETMVDTTVDVTVEEKEEPVTPVEPEKPATGNEKPAESKPEDNKQENTKPATDNGDKYVDEDGKEITKLPQAGSLVPSIVLGIAVLGIATVAGYKVMKNK